MPGPSSGKSPRFLRTARRVTISAPVLALLLGASAGLAAELRFDARGRTFVNPPSVLSAGSTRLWIHQPQIFRESYHVVISTRDYHTAELSEALKALFASGKPRDTSAAFGELEATAALGKPEGETLNILRLSGGTSVDEFETNYSLAVELFSSLRDASSVPNHVDELLVRLRLAPDNASARSAVYSSTGEALRSLGVVDLAREFESAADLQTETEQRELIRPALEQVLAETKTVLEDKFTRVAGAFENDEALSAWVEEAKAWRALNCKGVRKAACEKAVAEAVTLNTERAAKVKSHLAAARKALDTIGGSLRQLIALADFCSSEAAASDSLLVLLIADGDEATVEVHVSAREGVFEALKEAHLKTGSWPAATLTLPVRGSRVFDVSAGIVVHDIVDRGYFVEPTNSGGGVVRKSAGDDAVVSTYVMGQIGWKVSGHTAIGIGAGLTPTSEPTFLLGPVLQFGSRFRLTLGAGIASGARETLQGQAVGDSTPNDKPRLRKQTVRRPYALLGFSITLP